MAIAKSTLALALSATLFLTASAYADQLITTINTQKEWFIPDVSIAPSASSPLTFRVRKSGDANSLMTFNFTSVGQTIDMPTASSSQAATLATYLTNGTQDAILFSLKDFDFVRNENFFQATNVNIGPTYTNQFPAKMNGTDWGGIVVGATTLPPFTIDDFKAQLVSAGAAGTQPQISFSIFGSPPPGAGSASGVPEPASVVLLLAGGFMVLWLRRRFLFASAAR